MSSASETLYDIEVRDISGTVVSMRRYRGRVLLVVNVASRCGFTPQYTGLQSLFRRHEESGLVVLGFPCDQFGHQEPGSDQEISAYCTRQYGVTFPMFSKIDVNGERAHPLYRLLKERQKGLFGSEAIKWNFTKFLVDRHGDVLKRYPPSQSPDRIAPDVEAALAAPVPA